jgi:isopentenyl-diphosphate Delta-isomerase
VVLVDGCDVPIGELEKLAAHREGLLHRAFSVFVVNAAGEILLQRRAGGKYHSGGLWSNTCCGHPRPGEDTRAAARRRLGEEMGFVCDLRPVHRFTYRALLEDGLIEHEVDHVFVGRHERDPTPDPEEVEGWRWMRPEILARELRSRPEAFTAWLPPALRGFLAGARRDLAGQPGAA